MDLQELRQSNLIVFETISGSQAYGTNTPESDIDTVGIFRLPKSHFLSLLDPLPQITLSDPDDITFYELKRIFQLLKTSNPNLIELLWMPKECLIKTTPVSDRLIANRDIFITKKAYYTHVSYAFAQIKRAKGVNKWINNPFTKDPPTKEDFCWIIDPKDLDLPMEFTFEELISKSCFPFRPIPLKESQIDLSKCHAAGLEHVENAYRLYYYGDEARGVFRNGYLTVESIPIVDEWNNFEAILIYNEQAYDKEKRNWDNYWDWKTHRNEARYRAQEAGELDYDAKNIMHCIRLLWSGRNILENGEPIVRFTGEKLEFLKNIRKGKYPYENLIAIAEAEVAELELLKESSKIPAEIDFKKIKNLYEELINIDIGEGKYV